MFIFANFTVTFDVLKSIFKSITPFIYG